MYEMDRIVCCSNISEKNVVRNSSLVDFLQDCSISHIDNHPVLAPFFEEENCVMYLVSRQLDIIRMPEYNEKLHIKTWCYELKRMYGYRNTIITDENNSPVIICYATGAFMDTVTQRPRKISQELCDKVTVYPKFDMEYTSRKIAIPHCEPQVFEPVTILKCFIDMNRHVNNARYLDITDEYLPENALLKRIRIEYKMPLKRGYKAIPKVYTDKNTITVNLCDHNGKSFTIVEYTLS